MDAIGKMIGLLALVMFAVDCIVSAVRSSFTWERVRNLQKKARVCFRERVRAQSRQAVILQVLTAVLCLAAVNYTALRVGKTISAGSVPASMDVLLTWIVLVAGIDRAREVLHHFKGMVESAPQRKEMPAISMIIDNENKAHALPKAV